MSEAEHEDRPRAYRPALVSLTEDVRGHARELERGLESERRAVEWVQESTILTLGNMDDLVYQDLARQFRGGQGVLLAAFVVPSQRDPEYHDLPAEAAADLRERFVGQFLLPAYQQAFRELRTDVNEYVDEAGEGDAHDPQRQTHVAMRPALTELGDWQERAVTRLLDGFGARGDILDWAPDVVLATHGQLDRDWVRRVHSERSTVATLCGDDEAAAAARRLFAVYHLLPRFRDGVRVLYGRAGELADVGETPSNDPPEWRAQ